MVFGLDLFKAFFAGYENQYVLIGGAACDVLFEYNDLTFRSTKDIDVVLIVEALTPEFGERFWEFIMNGHYSNKSMTSNSPRFYRFEKPIDNTYPRMIELFCRSDFELKEAKGITPIHFADDVSSLSAILLDKDYYQLLLRGKTIVDNISVLKPECLILFKMKAFLDMRFRHENGEESLTKHIKKHKKDILRLTAELMLTRVEEIPESIMKEINEFVDLLLEEPFDANLLREYGLRNDDVVEKLKTVYSL